LATSWIAATILVLLAISHGRSGYIRWSAAEHARHQAEAKRQAEAGEAKTLSDFAATTRKADGHPSDAVPTELAAIQLAPPIELPQLELLTLPAPESTGALAVAVTPTLRCDGAEAHVAIDSPCLERKGGFKDCPECPEMVVVPAGEVMMGSQTLESGRAGNEGPRRTVTIEKRFAAGKFETTFEEWGACLRAGACKHTPGDQGWGKDRHPVVNVSWEDAKEYVAWLSKRTGLIYRLLTEAEWEHAARAGTVTAFSTGASITSNDANFDGGHTYGGSSKGYYSKSTVEVGSFQPNAFGLYDMHGNVWEWVEDCWHADYKGGPADGSAWTTRCNERSRVLRGGSWIDPPRILRSAYRSRNVPAYRGGTVGFRVARTLD
jgi:formylglycine-generating enzyme required for sulfatase activity